MNRYRVVADTWVAGNYMEQAFEVTASEIEIKERVLRFWKGFSVVAAFEQWNRVELMEDEDE